MQEIKGQDYHVIYDSDQAAVTFEGLLRLQGLPDYTPITNLLNDLADQKPETITLNLRELMFLNSSGIDMMLKFVIKVRKLKSSQLTILVSREIPWHKKSLNNLQRLMPDLKLEFE